MTLREGAREFAAALLLAGRQRLELAAIDIEEELLRAGGYLAALLLVTSLLTLALAALAAAVAVWLWPLSPVGALLGIAAVFAAAAAAIWRALAESLRNKPPLLAATLQELGRDADLIGPRTP